MPTIKQKIEEQLRSFDEKFKFSFNIGVIPDDMTKENIKSFLRNSSLELIEGVIEMVEKSKDSYKHFELNSFELGRNKALGDIITSLKESINAHN